MRRVPVLFVALLGACASAAGPAPAPTSAPAAWRARPGTSDGRVTYYGDDQGLSVVTAGAEVTQPVSEAIDARLTVLADRVSITPGEGVATSLQDVDAVSSASVLAGGDGEARHETRYEASLAGIMRQQPADLPVELEASARLSAEPDYRALSARLAGKVELFQRNTTATAFLGLGHDTIDPDPIPEGQRAAWPATAQRVTGGGSLSQVLAPWLVASAGAALGAHSGQLTNPYRYALVRGQRVLERLPSSRLRGTAFVASSAYVGAGTAAHLRLGGYRDDWGVRAVVPELELVHELGERGLVSLRGVLYRQEPARFYAPSYDALAPDRTGDVRLGHVRGVQGFIDGSWLLRGVRDGFGVLELSAGYSLSRFAYRDVDHEVVAHVGTLGVRFSY